MLSATMMWAEFYTEGVTASEGSLLSGDENGDPLPCAVNKKGECQVIQPKTAAAGSVVYSFLFFIQPIPSHS